MKILAAFLLILLLVSSPAIAYPQDQLKECMLGAKRSPTLLGVPEVSIEKWCDCALRLTLDEEKEDIPSANECGKKYFK